MIAKKVVAMMLDPQVESMYRLMDNDPDQLKEVNQRYKANCGCVERLMCFNGVPLLKKFFVGVEGLFEPSLPLSVREFSVLRDGVFTPVSDNSSYVNLCGIDIKKRELNEKIALFSSKDGRPSIALQNFYARTFNLKWFKDKQWGVVSKRAISKGEVIEQYSGEEVSRGHNDYHFAIPKGFVKQEDGSVHALYDLFIGITSSIDAKHTGSFSRFFNSPIDDTRGNVSTCLVVRSRKFYVLFIANRDIPEDIEVDVNHGSKFSKAIRKKVT